MKVLKVKIEAEFPLPKDAFEWAEAVSNVEGRIGKAISELTATELAGPPATSTAYEAKTASGAPRKPRELKVSQAA